MLSFDGGSPDFLAGLPPGGLEGVPTPTPATCGPYRVLGEIAHGGMGVVLRGHDDALDREVAIKILRGPTDGPDALEERFVEEARIGGRLQHPGIVPVYQLGHTEDRRPFFAMKLIEGRTLAELLAGRPDLQQDAAHFLAVFETVCQTMAYAHDRGVVHRDLKPANVMVGAFGEVQVVDWGLAAAPSRDAPDGARVAARAPAVMGTPAYMSPEQARGAVELLDERTDVFALGAILCEILTGAPPYTGRHESALRQAAAARLEDARARLASAPADRELVALALRCLESAPEHRPAGAQEVAQAVRAHLASVEERARRAAIEAAEARVQVAQEQRVRRRSVGLLASLVLGVTAGGGAWLRAERLRAANDKLLRDEVAAALSEASLLRGQERWAGASAVARRALALARAGGADEELVQRVAGEADDLERERAGAERRDQLERANRALLGALAEVRQPEDTTLYPRDWAELDRAYGAAFMRADIALDGEQDAARAAARLAERGIATEIAAALDEWSLVRVRAGDARGAASLAAIADRLDGDGPRTRLRAAIRGGDAGTLRAAAAEAGGLPAPTTILLANALRAHGALDEAVSLLGAARDRALDDYALGVTLARTLRFQQPRDGERVAMLYSAALALRPASVEVRHELGRELHALGRLAEAETLFRSSLELRPDDAHLHYHLAHVLADHGDVAGARASYQRSLALDPLGVVALVNYGGLFDGLGDLDGALACYREAIAVDPGNPRVRVRLGGILEERGEHRAAVESCRAALALDPREARAYSNLGNALLALGERQEAVACFERALALEAELVEAHIGLGNALGALGNLEAAIASHRRALSIDDRYAKVHHDVGHRLMELGRLEPAIASLRRAIEIEPRFALAHATLGWALWQRGDPSAALETYRRGLAIDPDDAALLGNLGVAQAASGDLAAAIESYRHALRREPQHAAVLLNLGEALWRTGAPDEAMECARRSLASEPGFARAHGLLGILHGVRGELAESVASFQRAVELDPTSATHRSNLALSQFLDGDPEGATRSYAEALALDPTVEVEELAGLRARALERRESQ